MSYTKGNPFANKARQMDPYSLVEQVLKLGKTKYLINLSYSLIKELAGENYIMLEIFLNFFSYI